MPARESQMQQCVGAVAMVAAEQQILAQPDQRIDPDGDVGAAQNRERLDGRAGSTKDGHAERGQRLQHHASARLALLCLDRRDDARCLRAADQIELVDITPEALRRRLAHGNVYAPERIDAALSNYFRQGNLTALRELALLWLADQVDANQGANRDRSVAHGSMSHGNLASRGPQPLLCLVNPSGKKPELRVFRNEYSRTGRFADPSLAEHDALAASDQGIADARPFLERDST